MLRRTGFSVVMFFIYVLLATVLVSADDFKNNGTNAESEAAKVAAEKIEAAKVAAENRVSIAESIGKNPAAMVAVLFAPNLHRSSFEVVKDNKGKDSSIGKIVQNESGGMAGIMVAIEQPFAYPSLFGKGKTFIPVGAWFGVQMQTGSGRNIDSVDLAAGFSMTLISEGKKKETAPTPARLLLGVVYGSVQSLGAGLKENDPYPLGENPPTRRKSVFALTLGLGFRF